MSPADCKKEKNYPYYFQSFKNFLQFILSNIALSLLVIALFMKGTLGSLSDFFFAFGWAFAICITQWLGHGYIFHYLDKTIDWIEAPVKRALWGLFALIVYSSVSFYLIKYLFFYAATGRFPTITWVWLIGNVAVPVGISFIITLVFTAISFFNAWKKSTIKAQQLNTEMLTYKYEVLRNQINPHFLFNSFNVLSDLVYEDQQAAVNFIQQLSKLFRYVLDSRDKDLVPLSDEIDFVNSFAFLLTTRFQSKLSFDIQIDCRPDEYIVPVSIQMLIENAVKHNEVSEAYPLSITIRKTNDYVEVINTLKIKYNKAERTQTGIKNLHQQFAFFTEKPLIIEKTDSTYVVRLPIIKSAKL